MVMCVPAPKGAINPLVLAAAKIAGVHEIYRVGGAQAVAAMAYGTDTIEPVDKIVGPGNAYVAEAKRQVFGHVGIDMIAGPSEILVVADAKNDPKVIAIDLLSQAEHDETAQSILITNDAGFADAVCAAVDEHLSTLASAATARQSWNDFGAVIVVGGLRESHWLVDQLAPEHLMIATDEPDAIFEKVRHAGAVFLGRETPEAIGDYVAGSNHVLPTGRSARFSSGLTVFEFMKRTSVVRAGEKGLHAIGPTAVKLAEAEGLPAHARSVAIRLGQKGESSGKG
jgi:histidinol dehydrogenase